jgi:hypothetical protein
LFLPGAEEGGGIEVGDDIGVEEPEGLIDEPAALRRAPPVPRMTGSKTAAMRSCGKGWVAR